MAEANWMMGIELPGVQRGLVKQSVNMKLATEVSEADFEDLFTKELIDAVAGLITPHATLFREEDPINGEVFAGIEFGFIPDLNEYRKQLHDALLAAYREGLVAAVVDRAEKELEERNADIESAEKG